MRIALRSTSPAVTRALAELVTQAGHSIAAASDPADFLLAEIGDASARFLTLERLHDTTTIQRLQCPIHPTALLDLLVPAAAAKTAIALSAGWVFSPTHRHVQHPDGTTLTLTEKESDLLQSLIGSKGQAISREALLDAVWGVTRDIDTHTLETHIYRLRSKLEQVQPSPGHIHTEAGSYRLVTQA
jgi:DNA-binding response OmpR family regulator